MRDEIEIESTFLGLRPYALVEIEEITEDGHIALNLNIGGGMQYADLRTLMELVLEGLDAEDTTAGGDDTF